MAKQRANKLSIIIPTYTGEEHIGKCFDSILAQEKASEVGYEIVVVIDGPNDSLRQLVDRAAEKFMAKGIDFSVHQFAKNQGRFNARKKGAELARYGQLLFVDDRVALDKSFTKNVLAANEKILMPNVLEASQPNQLSRLNYLLRRKIYGTKMWGTNFEPYFIDEQNFERSPKGTTSLWLPKGVFLDACEQMEKESSLDAKNSSDDTLLLKLIVADGHKIFRSSQAKVYYHPRSEFSKEAAHLYHRGPKFVDYYFKRGTRFFPAFVAAGVALVALIALVIIEGLIVLLCAVGLAVFALILIAAYLAEKPRDFFDALWTLPLAAVLFSAGVIKGLLIKLRA